MRRLRDESGFTLIELMIVSVMFLVILGASLTTFDRFQGNARLSEQRNDASEEARRMADALARDLRNLADPTTEAKSIEHNPASGTDLVFRSVDPSATGTDANRVGVRRVRYCLDAPNGYVWRATQTWTTLASPAAPATTACGAGDAWTGTCAAASTCDRKVVAQFVTNSRSARPLFTYDSATAESVTYIRLHADIDVNAATAGPAEILIESGVTLRNQNRRPVAALDPPVRSGGNDFVLNASASVDPEGALLTYQFLRTPASGVEAPLGGPQISPSMTTTLTNNDSVRVKVEDPGHLSAYSDSYTVTTP